MSEKVERFEYLMGHLRDIVSELMVVHELSIYEIFTLVKSIGVQVVYHIKNASVMIEDDLKVLNGENKNANEI